MKIYKIWEKQIGYFEKGLQKAKEKKSVFIQIKLLKKVEKLQQEMLKAFTTEIEEVDEAIIYLKEKVFLIPKTKEGREIKDIEEYLRDCTLEKKIKLLRKQVELFE